mgnify:FL=1
MVVRRNKYGRLARELNVKSADSIGLVHVYTGNGPGKTRAAIGLAMRALGQGYEVNIIQFLKGKWKGKEEFGEVKIADKLDGLHINRYGTGKLIQKEDDIEDIDLRLAAEGLKHAERLLEVDGPRIVILDEVHVAIHYGLLKLNDILELIETRAENIELILTGEKAPQEIREKADYLVIFESEKHPYQDGIEARKGIEY